MRPFCPLSYFQIFCHLRVHTYFYWKEEGSASGSLCCEAAEAAFSEGGTDGLRQSGSRIAKMLKTGYPLSLSPSLLEGIVC